MSLRSHKSLGLEPEDGRFIQTVRFPHDQVQQAQ